MKYVKKEGALPHRWKAGESGNPSGRPKDELGAFLRDKKNLPQDIYNAIFPLLQSSKEQSRIQAAEFLRDSAWGRPMQALMDFEGRVFPFTIIRPDEQRKAA